MTLEFLLMLGSARLDIQRAALDNSTVTVEAERAGKGNAIWKPAV